VFLRKCGAADSGDDGRGVAGVIRRVRRAVCGGWTALDCAGTAVASAAVASAVFAAERAAVDGGDELYLLFRWFVGLEMDDEVWDVTVFTKNRERLIAGEVAQKFFAAVLSRRGVRRC